jgi:uncharacterized integral membrane protein
MKHILDSLAEDIEYREGNLFYALGHIVMILSTLILIFCIAAMSIEVAFNEGVIDLPLWIISIILPYFFGAIYWYFIVFYFLYRDKQLFWDSISYSITDGHILLRLLVIVLFLPLYIVELIYSIFVGIKRN